MLRGGALKGSKQWMLVSFMVRAVLEICRVVGGTRKANEQNKYNPYMLIFYMNFGPDRSFPYDV